MIDKLDLLKDIQFLPVIEYDEWKENLILKLEKDKKELLRVKANEPSEIKIEECKRLFDTLTKSQNNCFIFLIFCIISNKIPII
jgi:hypothetical protein